MSGGEKMKWWWNENKYAFGFVKDLIHYNWKARDKIPKTITRQLGRTSGKVYHLLGTETYPIRAIADREAKRLGRKHPSNSYYATLVAHAVSDGLKHRDLKNNPNFPEKRNVLLPIYCIYTRKKD
jgi:hypothetical protein